MLRRFLLLLGCAAFLGLTLGAFGQGVSLVMWSKETGPILEFSMQLAQQYGERTGNTIEVV
ncbi:MAG: hypothetical protein HY335_11300, partial [Deinococcus sp.]|nr:hypothetical protein [Deinococcus sp.]